MKNVLYFLIGLSFWCSFWWLLALHCSVWSFVVGMTIEAGVATTAFLWMLFLRPWPEKVRPPKMKFKYLTLTLTALIAWTACNDASAKATLTKAPPVTPVTVQPQQLAGCGVALGVLAAGVVIAVGLKKMCAGLNPPPPEPPFPPLPVFPIPVMPWVKVLPMVAGPVLPQMDFDDSGVQAYDISSYGWTDNQGFPFYAFFKTTLQSCGDMQHWTNECSVVGYVSYGMVGTVWSDCHGNPCMTNSIARAGGYSTNNCSLQIDMSGPVKFFRLMSEP